MQFKSFLLSTLALGMSLSMTAASGVFKWTPAPKAAPRQWQQYGRTARTNPMAKVQTEPSATLPTSHVTGYVDAPNGSSWYYTMDYDQEILFQNEYYTDYSISGVHITVYDDQRQEVGKVNATWEKPADVSRIQSVQIGAVVTQKFFNSSDKYELMLMLNYNPAEGYGAKQNTKVFSITPEGDGECLATLPGYYVSAVNTAQDNWSENYYFLFCDNSTWPDADSNMAHFTLYSKAGWSNGPKEMKSWDINMRYSYSDGENEGMPFIMNGQGNTLWLATAQYEKTYFTNPDDYTDESLSQDNHYVMTLYKTSWNSLDSIQTTRIAVEAPEEGYFMRTYCVGQFLGAQDLTFDFNEAGDENPKYIIRINQMDTNENSVAYFAVYDKDGNPVKTWGEGSRNSRMLCPIEGKEQQFVFAVGAGYETMNYPSLTQGADLPTAIALEDGVWALSSDLDRVPVGGSYKYAISFLNGDEDEEGNTIHRVAWYNADGSEDRVDALNVGQNVARVMVYLSGEALNPHLFNTDDAQEYAVYVQKLVAEGSSLTQMHLCIVDATGKSLADIPFGLNSADVNTMLVNPDGHAALFYYYYTQEDERYVPSFIDLPLNQFEGEGTVDNPYLICSAGDMNRVRYNLDKHFRLANDIHYDGAVMKNVTGTFTGSLDGNWHTIYGPTVKTANSTAAMFESVGELSDDSTAVQSFIKNLYVNNPTVLVNSRNNGNVAVLAGELSNAVVENVMVDGASITVSDGQPKCDVGGLVGNCCLNAVVRRCEMSNANIVVPSAYNTGGMVQSLMSGASIEKLQFSGNVEGNKNVGGLLATTAYASTQAAPGSIKDCRVANATIKGTAMVGGIIGDNPRALIQRCVFSGSLEATKVQTGYYEESFNPYDYLNVGGIAGRLTRGNGEAITDCMVDIHSITLPEDASEQALATVHRIAGWSSVNDEPQILSETLNEETWEYEFEYGDPAPAETGIHRNYATGNYAAPEATATASGTDGETKDRDSLNQAFYENLGYDFTNLWALDADNLPMLFTESSDPVGISGTKATTATAGYYDLQGRRVLSPAHGIYVKVENGKATKVKL